MNNEYDKMRANKTLSMWIENCQELADQRAAAGMYFNADDALPILSRILNHEAREDAR